MPNLISTARPTSDELRSLIAVALYPTSANDLPAVCTILGLAPGEVQEAFASKQRYVRTRLLRSSFDDLVALARRVLAERSDHALKEAIAKIDEAGGRILSPLTRRRLFAALNGISLSGADDLIDFLRRFWPIDQMRGPGNEGWDTRTLAETLVQHAVRNDDWTNEGIMEAVGARTTSQTTLFDFLEAVVHPEIREATEQGALIECLNPILQRDGFAFAHSGAMSGYPVYAIRPFESIRGAPPDSAISETLSAFDEEYVHTVWQKALDRRSSDPEGAITSARTLLETVCKQIIEASGSTFDEKDDLPELYKSAATVLNLAPDQHTEKVFKAILGSCQNVVNSLGTLRNRLSDAHGRGRKPVRPQPRHAELAVNLAGAMATFLVSTWRTHLKNTGA